MELGPLQEMWLQSLEKHPERQMRERLGEIQTDGTYKACCLGELQICYHRMKNKRIPFVEWVLVDGFSETAFGFSETALIDSYEKYGLISGHGHLRKPEKGHASLASMNDNGWTWPEIAKYIRENPENVFIKSV